MAQTTTNDRIPFTSDHEDEAAEYLAEQLRLRGHDAHDEYLGSNTSVVVMLSPTRQALLAGWGDLDGWVAEFDNLEDDLGGKMWCRDEGAAAAVPDSDTQDIDRLVLVLNQFLGGVYPEGYGPRDTEVRPLDERLAFNSVCDQIARTTGEAESLADRLNDLTDMYPYVVLADDAEVKAALSAAADAMDEAYRKIEEAHRVTTALYGRYEAPRQ